MAEILTSENESMPKQAREKVRFLPLSEIQDFPDHPFQVRDDDSMKELIEDKKAEMYVDKGIGIIIAVVVGAIVLAGVYAVIKTNVLTGLGGKVDGLWNYTA